mgnify:CR=1 FL=1
MGTVGIYVRVSKELLEEFTKIANALGLSRSEAIRKAMELFIMLQKNKTMTSKMRGLMKSKFTLKELEEIYLVSR